MEDKRQEDLDMIYVFKIIKQGIVSVIKSFINLVNYTIKNILVLAVFAFIFAALGLGIYFLSKPYFTSELTVSHIRLENDYCKEIINSLNKGISSKKNNSELAEKLSLNIEYAKEVRRINFKVLNEQVSKRYSDSVKVMLPFKIEVEVYTNEILDSLENSLLNYLENNEYSIKRKEVEKQSLDKIEERLNKEIMSLDSLKRLVANGIVPQSLGSGIILSQPINPVVIYDATMKLYEQKMRINEKQHLNNNFELVVGFSKNEKPESGKLLNVLIGGMVGYLIGLFYLSKRRLKNN